MKQQDADIAIELERRRRQRARVPPDVEDAETLRRAAIASGCTLADAVAYVRHRKREPSADLSAEQHRLAPMFRWIAALKPRSA